MGVMLDFEVQRCTRSCAETGRAFEPGDSFYSVLIDDGAEIARKDYAIESWKGPPDGALGWWKSTMPEANDKQPRLAPNDVMLDLFTRWSDDEARLEMRYVLALLLIQRRVLREEGRGDASNHMLSVYCPRNDTRYETLIAIPDAPRAEAIQEELSRLLFATS